MDNGIKRTKEKHANTRAFRKSRLHLRINVRMKKDRHIRTNRSNNTNTFRNKNFIMQDHFTSLPIHSNFYWSYIYKEKHYFIHKYSIYVYICIIVDGTKSKGFQPEKDTHTHGRTDKRSYKRVTFVFLKNKLRQVELY
jgi:hypothetical protein